MSAPPPSRLAGGLAVSLTTLALSASLIVQAAPVHPLVVAASRVIVTGVVWGLLSWRAIAETWRVAARDREVARLVAIAALFLAAHFACWVSCLSYTTVAQGAVLVSMTPLFAGLLGRLLGDRCTLRFYVGVGVAIAGMSVLVAGRGGDAPDPLLGNTLSILASLFASIYLLAGRRIGRRLPLTGYLTLVNLGAGSLLALTAVGFGVARWPEGAGTAQIVAIALLGLLPGWIGHGMQNWAARYVPVHLVAIALLLEPPTAVGVAWIWHGLVPGPREALGAGIVTIGVALGLIPAKATRSSA